MAASQVRAVARGGAGAPRAGGDPIATDATVGDPLGGLAGTAWDELAGPEFYSSSAWLTFTARDATATSGAVIVEGRGGRTAVPIADVTHSLAGFYDWAATLSQRGLPSLPSAGVLVGPRSGYQTHILGASAQSGGPDAILTAIRSRLDVMRTKLNAPAASVAMFLTTADVRFFREHGVTAVPVLLEADAWIPVPEGTFDDWIETLPSKRRVVVRRERRRFAEEGFVVRHESLANCVDAIAPLALATFERYGGNATVESQAALLREQAAAMGDAARIALCFHRDDPRPAGYCIYYVWHDRVYLRWAGFDYAALRNACEYFNVVYYAQVAVAQSAGARWLHAGIKATDAKVMRGAHLRPLWLLDLSPKSPHADDGADDVRGHNRDAYATLANDPRVASGIHDDDEWREFS